MANRMAGAAWRWPTAPHHDRFPGLHHVAVICCDYPVSKRFYTESLDFKILSEVYRAKRDSYKLDLEIPGGTRIELYEE